MKPIQLTQEIKDTLTQEFREYINNLKTTTNVIHFTTTAAIPQNKQFVKPKIYIPQNVYTKMLLYVQTSDMEIAWHGTIIRDTTKNEYTITDVFLYPQIINAATVNTDQEAYQNWLTDLPDEVFNYNRLQGHSHVNMHVSPSSTDIQTYNNFLQTLTKDDYYVFMIMNKRCEFYFLIYDLAQNAIYENTDITVEIINSNPNDIVNIITAEKNKYCTRQTTYFNNYNNYNNYKKIQQNMFNQISDDYNNTDLYGDTKDWDDYLDEIEQRYGTKRKNNKSKTKKK